jgi:hypothetical protein
MYVCMYACMYMCNENSVSRKENTQMKYVRFITTLEYLHLDFNGGWGRNNDCWSAVFYRSVVQMSK